MSRASGGIVYAKQKTPAFSGGSNKTNCHLPEDNVVVKVEVTLRNLTGLEWFRKAKVIGKTPGCLPWKGRANLHEF